MKRLLWTAAAITVAALVGCQASTGGGKGVKVKSELAPAAASYNIQKVAILSLANTTGDPQADQIVNYLTRALYDGKKYQFTTIEELAADARRNGLGDDYDRMVNNWRRARTVEAVTAEKVIKKLGYDAVLGMEVNKWEEVKLDPSQEGTSNTSVGVELDLYANDGTLLWTGSNLKVEKSVSYNPEYNVRATQEGQARTTSAGAVPDPPKVEKVAVGAAQEIADAMPVIHAGTASAAPAGQ